MMLKYAPTEGFLEYLESLKWSVSTSAFGAPSLTGLPLIVEHPTTKRPCLRYHEPWPQSKTNFDSISVGIDNVTEQESAALCSALNSLLRDRRVTYYHTWQKGDLVVNDNTLTMHTRSEFKSGSTRELWRIHFN
jgi:alpha-ketoglutarate-dependent taurine dioxygenase